MQVKVAVKNSMAEELMVYVFVVVEELDVGGLVSNVQLNCHTYYLMFERLISSDHVR